MKDLKSKNLVSEIKNYIKLDATINNKNKFAQTISLNYLINDILKIRHSEELNTLQASQLDKLNKLKTATIKGKKIEPKTSENKTIDGHFEQIKQKFINLLDNSQTSNANINEITKNHSSTRKSTIKSQLTALTKPTKINGITPVASTNAEVIKL